MIDELKRHLQYFAEKTNNLSISLFSARQEIANLRRMCAFDIDIIEKLVAEKNALSDKVCRLKAELDTLRPRQDIPTTATISGEITDLILSANLYPGDCHGKN